MFFQTFPVPNEEQQRPTDDKQNTLVNSIISKRWSWLKVGLSSEFNQLVESPFETCRGSSLDKEEELLGTPVLSNPQNGVMPQQQHLRDETSTKVSHPRIP